MVPKPIPQTAVPTGSRLAESEERMNQDEPEEESQCLRPCPPEVPCEECADYWDRMRAEGFWVNGKGWTDKGWREICK